MKLQTGDLLFEQWLSLKTSRYYDPKQAKSNLRQQNQMLFGGYFWGTMVPHSMK